MYIKVSEYDHPVISPDITKKDLAAVRDGSLVAVIRTDDDSFYYAETNEWLPMEQV
jgi:hypothetical protein